MNDKSEDQPKLKLKLTVAPETSPKRASRNLGESVRVRAANRRWSYALSMPLLVDKATKRATKKVRFDSMADKTSGSGRCVGLCGSEHKQHVLCSQCEEVWDGLSFESLQHFRLGHGKRAPKGGLKNLRQDDGEIDEEMAEVDVMEE